MFLNWRNTLKHFHSILPFFLSSFLPFWIRYENGWKNKSKLLDKREPEMYRFGGIAVQESGFIESLVSSSSTLISRFVSEMISVYVPLLWIFLFFIHCLLLFPSFPAATTLVFDFYSIHDWLLCAPCVFPSCRSSVIGLVLFLLLWMFIVCTNSHT